MHKLCGSSCREIITLKFIFTGDDLAVDKNYPYFLFLSWRILVIPFEYFKGSVHTWNIVGQKYLGCKKKQYNLLLIHFGEMSINY